eukprot:151475_1
MVDKIDSGLAQYYTSIGAQYYKNGIGKFKAYCEENGFDDESLEGELDVQDPGDCMLIEFDYDDETDRYTFPLERALYYEHELLTFGYIRRYLKKNTNGENNDEIPFEIPIDLIKLFARWFCLIDVKPLNDEESIAKEIFNIIQYIHKFGKAPPIQSIRKKNILNINELKVTRDYITDELLSRSKNIYSKQCPFWYQGPSKETTIVYFIATRELNNGFSFLQTMIDCYNRCRVISKWKGISYPVNTRQWYQQAEFMRELHDRDSRSADDLESAVRIFCTKNAPPIQLNPLYKIDDSIFVISTYIVAATRFIKMILNDEMKDKCPFQFDVSFGLDVCDPQNYSVYEDSGNEESDDEEIDRYRLSTKLRTDYIADIHSKLEYEKLKYIKQKITRNYFELSVKNEDFKRSEEVKRMIYSSFIPDQQFVNFHNETHPEWAITDEMCHIGYGWDDDNNNDKENEMIIGENELSLVFENIFNKFKDKVSASDKQDAEQDGEYPQNKRFCMFIDRRGKDNDKNKYNMHGDEISIYEPPEICRTIPKNHVKEWFFESCRRCIIPRRGYGNGDREMNYAHTYPIDDSTITGQTSNCGKLLTLSFHVESISEVRCYAYWSGQTQRFLSQDIEQLLPNMFADSIKVHEDDIEVTPVILSEEKKIQDVVDVEENEDDNQLEVENEVGSGYDREEESTEIEALIEKKKANG